MPDIQPSDFTAGVQLRLIGIDFPINIQLSGPMWKSDSIMLSLFNQDTTIRLSCFIDIRAMFIVL